MMRMPPRTHPIRRLIGSFSCLVVIAGLANVTALAGSARAAIDPGSTAQQIANAINATGEAVTGSFATKPPSGTPDAASDSSLASFPTDGGNYGILTTGDANLADDPNSSGSSGASDEGPNVRGNTDFDVSILKIDLDVPSGFTCLRVDFRFLSEEFPEFVGSQFNDAFIAELDTSDWTTNGSAITAENNFAFDPDGNPITINSTGFSHMTASEASGTTYDGATPILVAQTPIASGAHSIYLSIFDQGDHYYDSAAFLDNLSLGTQVGPECQPGAQPLSNLSLSVSPSTAPAGFSAMPKSTINYAALTVPGSAGASSLTTSPITHGPITHGPITHGPITHGPITHGPITHGPITHGAIVNADPVYRTASLDQLPLYASVPPILIATVPIASPPPVGNGPGPWSDALTPDTNLASLPFQTITLQQVANSSAVAANISVGDLDLSSTIFANLSPAALLFSNATFSQLGLTPPSGFSSSDHPADVELEGKSLASVDFNGVTLIANGAVRNGVLNSLISGTSLSGIEWESTTNGWNQPVSNLSAAAQAAVLDCPQGGCGTETLGDARNASHLKPLADLGDLLQNDPTTFSGKTFGQLLPGLFNVGSFPFEDAPLSQVLDAAAIDPASLVTYTAGADVPCPVPGNSATFTATLPGHGFRYAPGTSSVTFGAAPPVPREPSMSGNDLTWSFTNTETCGGQNSGTKHVEIGYKVEPGPEVGTFASSLHVTAGTTLSILDQAPETTTGNFESNNTPGSAQSITRDTLYTDTLQPGTDVDYFNIPVDLSDVGRTIQVSVSHIPTGMDYDLVLYGFAESSTLRGAPITHGPITHGPITHGPLADDAQCGPPGTVLEPQTLQDVPQVNSTEYAIRSYSTNRSTANEFSCTVIQPADVSHGITVQLSTFNAGTSPVPAVLSVEESDPTTPLQCVDVPSTPGDPGPDLPAPGSLSPDTQTLFLVNAEGIGRFYDPATPSAEADVISALTDSSFLSMPNVQGAVLSVDRDEGVAAALSAWYEDYCSPEAANNVVRAINNLVDSYRVDPDTEANRLPNLRNIVLVGSDAVLPFARIQELVNLGSESTEAPNVQFNDMDNPTSRALSLGYMLSDDPYYSFKAIPWLTTELYPPTVAGGRLVETSADIVNAIDQYKAFSGRLDPKTEFTTGYDFFLDSAQAKDDVLHKNYPYPKSGQPPTERASLLNNSWDKSELSAGLDAQPGFAVIDAHADHYRLAPAKAFTGGSVSPSDLYEAKDLVASNLADGTLAFSIGCHAGLSVADVWVSGADPLTLDWAQAFAQKKSVFNGNTGYGYGDSDVIAYTERLTVNLTENLGMRLSPPLDGGTMSIGQAIALAKQQYYAGLGSWGVFDSKAVEQFTPYGLPMYVIGPDGEVAEPSVPTPDHPLDPEPDPDTGLRTSTFQLSTLHEDNATPGQSGGEFYKGPTGLTQAEHYRPIEPITRPQEMTQPGLRLHGAVMMSFNKEDISSFTPTLSVPALAPQGDQPDPILKDATFPSWFVSPLSQDTSLGARDSLVVFGGQFVSDPDGPPNTGTQRLFSNATIKAYYSDPSNPFSVGIISSVGATDLGDTAAFRVTTPSPQSDVAAIYITFRRAGSDTFKSTKMTFNPDTGAWELTLDTSAGGGGKVAEYFAQMVTKDGDVSVSTFKALFSKPLPPPPVPGAVTITVTDTDGNPISPSAAGWYNKSSVKVDIRREGENFTAGVDGGSQQPVPVTVTGEGVHVVAFQGDQGSSGHFEVPLDSVKPDITITSPIDGATYTLNQTVAADYSCTDATSGVASCTGTKPSGENIDTGSIGAKTFTVNAADKADNTRTKQVTYYVGYGVCLLYDPGTPFRLSGSTIPLKLSICDANKVNKSSASITLTAFDLQQYMPGLPGCSGNTNDENCWKTIAPPNLSPNAGDGFVFRFDRKLAPGGGYIYNYSTKGLKTNNTYRLRFTASNEAAGTAKHSAQFSTK